MIEQLERCGEWLHVWHGGDRCECGEFNEPELRAWNRDGYRHRADDGGRFLEREADHSSGPSGLLSLADATTDNDRGHDADRDNANDQHSR